MKKRVYLLLIAIISCSLLGNALETMTQNDVRQPTFNRGQTDSPFVLDDSLTVDANLFHTDDSLLLEIFPVTQVKPLHAPPQQNPNFHHSLELHFTANDAVKPFLLMITSPELFNNLKKEIIQYAEDVHAIYGYGIYLEIVTNATAQQLKSLILSYQNNLCGVIAIGDFPACMFEIDNDYNKYGYRKWPCDLYYMDLDGIWEDTDNNGIYDSHRGNVGPDIYFARLSAYGMSFLGNEIDLLRRQFQKSHSYWWKSSFSAQEVVLGYIDKDWVDKVSANKLKQVFSSDSVNLIQYGKDSCFSKNDYLSRLVQSQYGFTHLASHSAPTFHQFTGLTKIYLSEIHNLTATSSFAYNLFCCSACNWLAGNSQGYLGGAYLFHEGATMTVLGSTKTGSMLGTPWFYNELPTKNIGDSFKQWWRNYYGDSSHTEYAISWSYGMSILGDPTIYYRHNVSDYCTDNLVLSQYPINNQSNLVLYRASQSIHVTGGFHIPQGVHVVFDAPKVSFAPGFSLVKGATVETRNEGCEL